MAIFLGLVFLLTGASIYSDTYEVKETWFGDPDLQGTWTNSTLTALERSANFKNLVVSEEQAEMAALISSQGNDAYDNYLKDWKNNIYNFYYRK